MTTRADTPAPPGRGPSASAPRRRRREQGIAERIKTMIVSNGMKPGERLPAERELMAIFAASRGSVREALSGLRAEGLIRTRSGPGGGVFLAEIGADRAMSLLSNYFLFRTPTIENIYAIRRALEPQLAASLAGRIDEADFARLQQTMRLYDARPATMEEEYAQRIAELDFHSVLAALCPNPLLGFFCGFLQTLLREIAVCQRIYDLPHPELRDTATHYQIRLMRALRAGDAEAAHAIMAEHMIAAEAYMLRVEAKIVSGLLAEPG